MTQLAPLVADSAGQEEEFLRLLRRQFPQPPCNARETTPLSILVSTLGRINGVEATSRPLVERVTLAAGEDSQRFQLSADHHALLGWVDESWRRLHIDYPLHPSLAIKVQSLLPAVAAAAVCDADFLYPGEHPLHRLLDQIYTHCMGWHRGLGRAGGGLYSTLEQIETALLGWFDSTAPDVEAILSQLSTFLEKERSGARKMRQRVLAGEQGKLKTRSARTTAARMLNEYMADRQFSAPIVALLQGPWYESLQLTLLKSGPDSSSWTFVKKLTETLIWTLQPYDPEDEEHQQQLFRLIPGISSQLGRALISLQNDSQALEQVLAEVESAHIGLMQSSPDAAVEFEPLDTGALDADSEVSEQMLEVIGTLNIDDCFGIKMDAGGMQRVHLALKLDEFEQLLFVNRLGMKALQKSFEEFACLLASGVAIPMAQGPAFTRCLLQALDNPMPAREQAEQEAISDLEPNLKEVLEQRLREEHKSRGWLEEQPKSDVEDLELVLTLPEEILPQEMPAEEIPTGEMPTEEIPTGEMPTEEIPTGEMPTEEIPTETFLFEKYLPEPAHPEKAPPEQAPLEDVLLEDVLLEIETKPLAARAETLPDADLPEPEPATALAEPLPDLQIGDWLRFTDGDEPQQCRLVVRIDSQDRYIFVNERGIRQRELGGQELSGLMACGQCEIVLQGSDFANSVNDMINRLRDSGEGE